MRRAGIDLRREPVRIFRGSENSLVRTAVPGHQRLLEGCAEHAIATAAVRVTGQAMQILGYTRQYPVE
jgi:hypothetical protein